MTIPPLQDLGGRPDLLVGRARHAERAAEVVDAVLVGCRHRSSDGFLADVLGTLPVGVDVASRQPHLARDGGVGRDRNNGVSR